jgi:hypothetical protein
MRVNTFFVVTAIFELCLASCVEFDRSDTAQVEQSVVTDCSSLPQQNIIPSREMVILDNSVIDDPCRTTFTPATPAACPANSIGKWTFGWLMTVMSGTTTINNAQSRSFVAKWLALWMSPQTVGSDPTPVAARGAIVSAFLRFWMDESGCTGINDPRQCGTLDLTKAPFRLLAIVNRVDLSGGAYGVAGTPGELRFVFGAFTKNPAASPLEKAINASVILEYKLPLVHPFPEVSSQMWASNFHQLSSTSLAFPSAQYNNTLQGITNSVVEPQAGLPNGSAIGQIRTNENAFQLIQAPQTELDRQWEFRQFALSCTTTPCQLQQVPVNQTPPTYPPVNPPIGTPPTLANNTSALTDYLKANISDLLSSRHIVPQDKLGGSSLSVKGNTAVLWNTQTDLMSGAPVLVSADPLTAFTVRHNFAFSTCNGCHYLETQNQSSGFHIIPRNKGAATQVSSFLKGTLSTTNYIEFQDPDFFDYDQDTGGPYLQPRYNEILRRSCEIRRVLTGNPTPFSTPTGHH